MYRNKKLRDSARHEPCVNCGVDRGTTVWAHSNCQRHGKGIGIKAHDVFGAYLCGDCHSHYDAGAWPSRDERNEWFIEQFIKSMIIACEKGYL
ncbi:MAG: DUF1364 domain-containing protein [Firmicutes bacterium]|nr:DUF1364 domain-containing protein [Bacillota bacterium]